MAHPAADSAPVQTRTPALPRLSRTLGVVVSLAAAVVLIAWGLDWDLVKSLGPGLATMKVNTAICLLALGIGLWDVRNRAVVPIVVLVAAVTVITMVEYAADLDLGIDEIFVADPDSGGRNPPGRMAQATAVSLFFLAWGLLAARRGRAVWAQGLVVVPGVVGLIASLGYLLSTDELYSVGPYSTMAVHTAPAVVLLAVGVGALVPGGVVSWTLGGAGPGPLAVRRMIPLVLLGVPLLGGLVLLGEQMGLYGTRFRLALLLMASMTMLTVAVVLLARSLERIDQARGRALLALHQANVELDHRRAAESARAEELGESLASERSHFARALADLEDLLWTVEVESTGALRLLFASPAAHRLLGAELQHGTDLATIIRRLAHPEDRDPTEQFIAQLLDATPAQMEIRIIGFDDVARWIWVRATPWEEEGRLLFDGIATDVTDRHELLEQRERLLDLEQAKVRELRELNRLREEFLAVASHELRTPLTSIRGFAELLAELDDLSPQQQEYVSVVVRRTHQMAQLIEDLYDLSRIRAGIVTLELRTLDVGALVNEAVEAQSQVAERAGVHLTVATDHERIRADPVRLRQVVDNLLANAIKYTEEGGRVSISTAPENGSVLISVSDSGIGIPEAELPHIFERMYRGSSANLHGAEGSGLGLSLCRAIVEAHGGRIQVRRNPTRGMTFEVAVPRSAAQPVGSRGKTQRTVPG